MHRFFNKEPNTAQPTAGQVAKMGLSAVPFYYGLEALALGTIFRDPRAVAAGAVVLGTLGALGYHSMQQDPSNSTERSGPKL
jgi:hypothetical protein